MLQVLLQANCPTQVSAEERGGVPLPLWGALFHACHKGYGPEAVKMLLSHGADILDKDLQRMTPITFAANQGKATTARSRNNTQVMMLNYAFMSQDTVQIKFLPPYLGRQLA